MSSSEVTIGEVIFTSIKPILKMGIIAIGGSIFARMGVLSPEVCKANAQLIMSLLLPLLIFSTVVPSFDPNNMSAVLVLVLSGVVYMIMGLIFGLIVRLFTPTPATWKGGIVAAGIFGNLGDLVIGYISTLAKSQPFKQHDVDLGIAYSSIFMVVQMVVLYNLGGIQLIKRDFDQRQVDVEKLPTPCSGPQKGATRRRVSFGAASEVKPSNPPTSIEHNQTENPDPSPEPTVAESALEEITVCSAAFSNVSKADSANHNEVKSDNIHQTSVTLFHRVWLALKPFITPPSISLIVSIIIANVQPLKALFIHTPNFSMDDAPDHKPPLDFIMEITRFAGPCVPVLGLILLGAAFSRLSVKNLPKGFWKSIVAMAVLKLVVGPIIGMVWTTQLAKHTSFIAADDKILRFVMIMTSGTPSATSQIYLTTIFAPLDSQGSVEMSALSALLLAQYALMLISLTAIVSYSLMYIL
ncbi:auxin efflux carrier [Kalaharituber pfeilii]|nr:auxin efflux carrier [Kalaharituber pfeilii]